MTSKLVYSESLFYSDIWSTTIFFTTHQTENEVTLHTLHCISFIGRGFRES